MPLINKNIIYNSPGGSMFFAELLCCLFSIEVVWLKVCVWQAESDECDTARCWFVHVRGIQHVWAPTDHWTAHRQARSAHKIGLIPHHGINQLRRYFDIGLQQKKK